MIVSVVIAALLQMRGNTSQQFFGIQKSMKTDQYSSFLLSVGDKYGFETSHMNMNRLVEEFDLESDLRRRLKAIRVELKYKELETRDMSESDENSSSFIFELGESVLKTEEFTNSLIRIRLQ